MRAGLQAIYLSGWQVAADANLAAETYPDQSLYPVNSVPQAVRRINNALMRADQITWAESDGTDSQYWLAPIVADAEAGFGGVLNAFELMKAMIAAGAAGVHWEDQLASEKKCGHLGGKVLIPTSQHIRTLNAARLAADVADVSTLVIARTDAHAATLITSDVDERDRPFITGERTAEGFYRVRNGMAACVARGLAYAPYSDLLWMETSTPDLDEAREFAEAIKARYPDQMLAYNCSPSFNWHRHLDDGTIEKFQRELGQMGYKFQFITLAGFHALNYSMFDLAQGYAAEGMPAYVRVQDAEFAAESRGYTATRHQREVGTGYFDLVTSAISPQASTTALRGSTESEQFARRTEYPPRARRAGPYGSGTAAWTARPGPRGRGAGLREQARLGGAPGGLVLLVGAVGIAAAGSPPPGRDEHRADHQRAQQDQHAADEHGAESRAVPLTAQRDDPHREMGVQPEQPGPGQHGHSGQRRAERRHRSHHQDAEKQPDQQQDPEGAETADAGQADVLRRQAGHVRHSPAAAEEDRRRQGDRESYAQQMPRHVITTSRPPVLCASRRKTLLERPMTSSQDSYSHLPHRSQPRTAGGREARPDSGPRPRRRPPGRRDRPHGRRARRPACLAAANGRRPARQEMNSRRNAAKQYRAAG